jgi:hypothetical protein
VRCCGGLCLLLLLGCTPPSGASDAGQDAGPDWSREVEWNCLGKVTASTPQSSTARLNAYFVTYELAGPAGRVTVPLQVRACGAGDADCAAPLAQSPTNANAEVGLDVPTGTSGFGGYLSVTGAGYAKTRAWFSPPVTADTTLGSNARGVPTPQALDAIAGAISETVDPSRGHLIVRARNCFGSNAVHVSLSVDGADGQSRTFYYAGSAPSPSARETDSTGLCGALNLPTGPATVRWSVSGKRIGELAVSIEAGTVTTLGASPLP